MMFQFKLRRYILEETFVDVEADTEEDAHELIGDMDAGEWDWTLVSADDFEIDDVIVK